MVNSKSTNNSQLQCYYKTCILFVCVCVCEFFIEGNRLRLYVGSVSFSDTALTIIQPQSCLIYLVVVEHVISLGILCRYVFVQRTLASHHLMAGSMGGRGNSFALYLCPASGHCCPCCWQGNWSTQEEFSFYQRYGGMTMGDQESRDLLQSDPKTSVPQDNSALAA